MKLLFRLFTRKKALIHESIYCPMRRTWTSAEWPANCPIWAPFSTLGWRNEKMNLTAITQRRRSSPQAFLWLLNGSMEYAFGYYASNSVMLGPAQISKYPIKNRASRVTRFSSRSSLQKRLTSLEHLAEELGLRRGILCPRTPKMWWTKISVYRGQFDLVTARAVASPQCSQQNTALL